MSMGALLLAGGSEDKRMALPNSKILIHQLGGFEGQATDIEIHAKEIINVASGWTRSSPSTPARRWRRWRRTPSGTTS